MKSSELRRLAGLALLLPLVFSGCKPASPTSSGSTHVPTETREHHTKGHKKTEKKAKKKASDAETPAKSA